MPKRSPVNEIARARRVLSIVNPVAGRSAGKRVEAALVGAFPGVEISQRETSGAGDAAAWAGAAAAEGYDLVIASGGDGTAQEVVSGILRSGGNVPVGIVPAGTANLLARGLTIPTDIGKAIEVILGRRLVPFDVGYIPEKDRYFLLAAGIGHPARIIRDSSRAAKNRFGVIAYVMAAARDVFRLRNTGWELEIDGRTIHLEAHTGLVINIGDFRELGLSLGPDISPHDGTFQLVLLSSHTIFGYLGALIRVLFRRGRTTHNLRYLVARRVRVRTRRPLAVQADGEMVAWTPLEFVVLPDAIRILVPRGYRPRRDGGRERGWRNVRSNRHSG